MTIELIGVGMSNKSFCLGVQHDYHDLLCMSEEWRCLSRSLRPSGMGNRIACGVNFRSLKGHS